MIIESDIAEIYKRMGSDGLDGFKTYLEGLRANQGEAEKLLRRSVISCLLAWTVFYLIGSGLVTEGNVGAFKVTNVQFILIAAPPIIGVLA